METVLATKVIIYQCGNIVPRQICCGKKNNINFPKASQRDQQKHNNKNGKKERNRDNKIVQLINA